MSSEIAIILLMMLFTGCATIMSGGGKQKITITSTPAEAEIVIHDRNGNRVRVPELKTPASVSLKRSSGIFRGADYQIEVKKEGYIP